MGAEVEIRGPLKKKDYPRVLRHLRRGGQLLGEADQTVIFFHVEKDQLSLKRDHDCEKIVLKFGDWGQGHREEVEVILKKGHFDNALKLLKGLGYVKGYRAPAFRQDFLFRGVQISLKTRCVIGPHYEMETVVRDLQKAVSEKKKLVTLARKLKLKVWTDRQYRVLTRRRWEAHHPGPEDL